MAAVAALATAMLDSSSGEDDYSFALEYHGPTPPYDIPRAVPIEIDRIPIATTAALAPDADDDSMLALPVVQPLPSPPPSVAHCHCGLLQDKDKDGEDPAAVVSPTSVIAFDRSAVGSEAVSGEIASSCGAASGGGENGCCGGEEDEDDEHSRELLCSSSEAAVGFSGEFKEEDDDEELEEEGLDGNHNGEDHRLDEHYEIPDFEEGIEPASGSRSMPLTDSPANSEIRFRSSSDIHDPSSSTAAAAAAAVASTSRNPKHIPAVKFDDGWIDVASGSTSPSVDTGSNYGKPSSSVDRGGHPSGSRPRKNACYKCLKGNRFTDKESCIVCGASYCARCLIRAMGSMPEGRKCVPCIGYAVDEERREGLGKSSRMLRKLFSAQEVQHIMKTERSCEANQISASHIVVNGKSLNRDEMILLKNCPNPPSKLKPGRYWYDRVSGYWGQEGYKPCKIISANLNVGGSLMQNASNGDTGVFINSREITKSELRMLQLARVQCAGSPHFWVNSDGTYQEEGMKTIKGNLWNKARMKVICSLLSLPLPPKGTNTSNEEKESVSGSARDYYDPRSLQKILLVGCHGSGTSTILKQAKFLYTPNPFSEEERERIKLMIQSNIYHYLGILLEGRERFEEECSAKKRSILVEEDADCVSTGTSNANVENTSFSISSRLKEFSDWLLKEMASGNLEAMFLAATREYAPVVEDLWKAPAIQATYRRRNELRALPSCASHFLEKVVDISRPEYEPSDIDILYATGIASSNGLAYTEFFFPHTANDCSGIDDASQHEITFRYQLIKVPTKGLTESCKWWEMFEDARMVIFCAALTDYDEYFEDQNGVVTNKMLASKKLFESIAIHPTFEQMDFLLILSKFDLLEAKIENSSLTKCDWFSDFSPVRSSHRQSKSSTSSKDNSHNTTPAQQAFHYIAAKFKRLFASQTGRKLYVVQANCLKADSVNIALRYAKEIQKWEDERVGWFDEAGDFSVFSAEPSSLSN